VGGMLVDSRGKLTRRGGTGGARALGWHGPRTLAKAIRKRQSSVAPCARTDQRRRDDMRQKLS
jgi:hypothetical protein